MGRHKGLLGRQELNPFSSRVTRRSNSTWEARSSSRRSWKPAATSERNASNLLSGHGFGHGFGHDLDLMAILFPEDLHAAEALVDSIRSDCRCGRTGGR